MLAHTQHATMPVERRGEIAIVSFDRQQVRNAFNLAQWEALHEIMNALSADDTLRCIVLRGAGREAFCAGADISEFETTRNTAEGEARYATVLDEAMQSIRMCRHPVVAMIMGYCLGGGAGIATMCDFRVAGEGLRFGITARNLGIWYPYAEIDPIIQMVGTAVASEILIEGRIFNGREAYEKGLLSRLVPEQEVEAEALALAARIASGSPLSARFHKQALRRLRGPLPVSAAEEAAVSDFTRTEDFRNATKAFLAKQKPVWKAK